MKKVMLLAAMLAMVLVAAAPVMAQDDNIVNSGNDNSDNSVNGQYTDDSFNTTEVCANVVGDIGVVNGQYGGDVALDDESAAAIAQENNTSIEIVQGCYEAAVAGGEIVVSGGGTSGGTSGGGEAASASASESYSVLPDTGGASLIALGAGALLVAGGLLARKIVR